MVNVEWWMCIKQIIHNHVRIRWQTGAADGLPSLNHSLIHSTTGNSTTRLGSFFSHFAHILQYLSAYRVQYQCECGFLPAHSTSFHYACIFALCWHWVELCSRFGSTCSWIFTFDLRWIRFYAKCDNAKRDKFPFSASYLHARFRAWAGESLNNLARHSKK